MKWATEQRTFLSDEVGLSYMNLLALENYLKGKSGMLTLAAADANLPREFRDFLNTIPGQKLTLSPSPTGISLQGSALKISGGSSDRWPVAGMGTLELDLNSMDITVNNGSSSPLIQAVAAATLPVNPSLRLPVTVTALRQEFSPWQVKLAKTASSLTPTDLLLLGRQGGLPFDTSSVQNVLSLALPLDPDKFQITFCPNSEYDAILQFVLQAPNARCVLVPNVLALDGIDIYALVTTNSISATLAGHLKIGEVSLDAGVSLARGTDWTAFIEAPQGQQFPGLAALASWIGGASLGSEATSGFSSLNFDTAAFDASVQWVSVGFNPQSAKVSNAQIKALLTVAAVPLDVVLTLPDIDLVGSLHNGPPVKVKDMLSSVGLPADSVPDNLTVGAVNFSASPRQGFYSVGAQVENVWQAGPFALEELGLLVFRDQSLGFAGQFNCQLALSSAVRLHLEAEYAGSGRGWTFVGGTAPDARVNVGDLLSALAQKFGITSVPQAISSLSLKSLNLSYETGTGTFTFSCTGDLTLLNKPLHATVNIQLSRSTSGTPGYSANFTGQVTFAGLQLNLVFSSQSQLITGTLVQAQPVSVGKFLQDAATEVGASVPQDLVQSVQGLQINNLTVNFDGQAKAFGFSGDTTTSGQIPFGTKSYSVNTRANLLSSVNSSTGQRSFTGGMTANLQIGKALFVVSFDFGPGAKVFKGQWRSTDGTSVGFADIAEALGIPHAVTVPQGLDLGLKSASFEYRSADSTFILAAESRLFGDAFFTAGKGQSGGWGFIFGVNFPPQAKLSSLPVIGNDLKAADFLTFKQSAVMLASTTFKNVVLPALPALPPQQIPGAAQSLNIPSPGRTVKPVASGATLQLNPGLSLAATLDFGASSGDAKTKNLQSIVGGDELLLQISMGQAGLSLYASLSGKVGIPSGAGKLALTNPAVRIDLTTVVVFQLSGGMSFVINGAKIVATARLIISETEAQVAVDISGDHGSLPSPPGVKGLHIQNFGMVMGVYFEPPGLDLGLQGKCRIGEVQGTRDNEFAIVLQVIEELPNILYLSFYVDRMDLGQVVTLFTNQTEPAIVQSMEIVKASDLSFHWSEGVVALPDGSIAQPGFGFSASIQIFNFGAHADLEVSVGNGVSGHAEMAPVNLKGLLVITGDGTGISRTYQQLNGQWQLVNNDSIVRQKPVPPTRKEVIVGPGGPIIEFNGLHSPFVHVNWQVTLFDVQKIRTDVTISSSGFFFVLTYDLGEIERFNLNCTLKDRDHFNASANFHLGVDTRIGPIRVLGIDCGTLHLAVRIDTGMNVALDPSLFRMGINGSFNFEGLGFSIPTVSLSVAPSSLKELPGKIIQQIKDHADQMFAALFADVQKWAEMIGRGLVAVADMANALKNAYNKTAQEAAQLMKVANQAAGTVASGLKTAYGLTADAAASAMKNAGYTADQVAAGLRQGYTLTAQAAITALKGAGYAADQVGNALKSAYGLSAQQVAQLLQQAGYAADQVGNALKTAFGVSAVQATQILRGAGFAANQAGSALKSAYGQTAEQTAIALRQAGYGANEVGDVLKSTFGQTVQQAAQLLKGAGYTADQVGSALKTAFGLSALQATQILRSAGFAANQVGSALKSAYGQTAQQTAAALRLLGYGANEVGDVLKSTFGQTPQQAAQVLKAAGYTVDQVGNALRTAYGATADVVASALKGAGYAVDQVGNFVKNAFNLGPDALKSVLQGAGYAGDQIGGFFKSLGGQFADAFKSVGNALNPTKW